MTWFCFKTLKNEVGEYVSKLSKQVRSFSQKTNKPNTKINRKCLFMQTETHKCVGYCTKLFCCTVQPFNWTILVAYILDFYLTKRDKKWKWFFMDAPFGYFFLTCRGIARTQKRARSKFPPPPFSGVEEISSQLITELNLTRGKFNACIKRAESWTVVER